MRLKCHQANLRPKSYMTRGFVLDTSAGIEVYRRYSLDELLDHVEGLADEIGEFLTWVWPLFQAAITGNWETPSQKIGKRPRFPEPEVEVEVDEDAPIYA